MLDPFNPATYRQLDPTYGRIRFSKYKWELVQDGFTLYPREEIESHVCTEEELGLVESKGRTFWPLKGADSLSLSNFRPMSLCIAAEEFEVYGNYNTEHT